MPRKSKQAGPKPNRSDLTAAGTQPISVPTGLPYGQHQEQVQAQRDAPLPQVDPLAGALAHLQAMPQPMAGVGMGGPSSYPHEPVTHGLPMGPGAGPEALGVTPRRDVADTLMRLAGISGSPELLALAQRAVQEGV